MLTRQSLIKCMPSVPRAKVDEYARYLDQAMLEFNITSVRRAAFFLAQVAHESNDLLWMEELATGAEYEGRRDLGNIHPGDGPRYKGRGPIQLTGRTNYEVAGRALGVDLVNNPHRAAAPKYAFRLAAWFWVTHGLNARADRGDYDGITRVINGGTNGLLDRRLRLARILAVRPVRSFQPATRPQRIRRRLKG